MGSGVWEPLYILSSLVVDLRLLLHEATTSDRGWTVDTALGPPFLLMPLHSPRASVSSAHPSNKAATRRCKVCSRWAEHTDRGPSKRGQSSLRRPNFQYSRQASAHAVPHHPLSGGKYKRVQGGLYLSGAVAPLKPGNGVL